MTRSIRFGLMTFAALLLMGCATTAEPDLGQAPPARVPALPDNLNQQANPLPPSTATTLPELIREGMDDDARYNELRVKFNALRDLYNCVRDRLAAD